MLKIILIATGTHNSYSGLSSSHIFLNMHIARSILGWNLSSGKFVIFNNIGRLNVKSTVIAFLICEQVNYLETDKLRIYYISINVGVYFIQVWLLIGINNFHRYSPLTCKLIKYYYLFMHHIEIWLLRK